MHLIRNGILERPLGGAISQARAGLPGTSNARADGWNRPPIDRMANLNLEPGDATLDDMIAGIERGVLMETNSSWSIDDSRNKFQFGCERGRLIENGKLGAVVKNPNYRGISANFWRSLARVGNGDTVQVLGTPYCGKGEPSQVDPRGARVAGVRVQRRRRVRRGGADAAAPTRAPLASRTAHDDGGLFPRASPRRSTASCRPARPYTAWFSAGAFRFRPDEPGKVRQPGSVVQRYLDVDLIRGARHATHQLSLVRRRRRRTAPRSRRQSRPRAPRSPSSPTIRIC